MSRLLLRTVAATVTHLPWPWRGTVATRGLSTSTTTGAGSLPRTVDVCIVGGGVVGTALACALKSAPLTAHLSVLLVDRVPQPVVRPPAIHDTS